MTEENQNTFGDALDAALADLMSEEVATEVESDEAVEAETEEIVFEDDNSEVEEEAVAEADEVEAEEDTEEVEEEAEEEEADEEQSELPTLSEDDEVVIDGETVKVKDALLRQADYTKKTQALSEERKAFEEERSSFAEAVDTMSSLDQAWAEDQGGVIATFLSNADDAIDAIGDAVKSLAHNGDVDPNMLVVRTIVNLISEDLLENDLREMLGFDDDMVAKAKEQSKQDKRIRKLERQVKQAPAVETSEADAIAAVRAELESQWNTMVSEDEHIASLDESSQLELRSEIAKLALDKGGIPLDVAWELLQAKQAKAEASAAAKKAKVVAKKRDTKAVSKPSNASAKSAPREPNDLLGAIEEAMRELGG